MSHLPVSTFELKVEFHEDNLIIKEDLKNYLLGAGIESFVEGVIDKLDIPHESMHNTADYYEEYGGDASPISLFSYSSEYLIDLKNKLERVFAAKIKVSLNAITTESWQDGWKEFFKPISTAKFFIYPPWETPDVENKKIEILIEPGMAFGTGQHATTQLVLKMLETHFGVVEKNELAIKRIFDVGIGSGILSVACSKLGFGEVSGCDIEPDSQAATALNAGLNDTKIQFLLGGLEEVVDQLNNKQYDLVLANILFVVLSRIIPTISDITRPGGDIILCGLLEEDEEEMTRLALACGLEIFDRKIENDWLCLYLKKHI